MARGIEALWQDSCDVYRETTNGDGDPAGWALVSEENACFFHGTPNYDQLKGVTSIKEDSVQTSDKVSLALSVDIRSMDRLKITLRTGGVFWVKVSGAPKERTIIPKKTVFVTTDRALVPEEIV